MNVYTIAYEALPASVQPHVAAIGYFDGVHLGHQAVVRKAIARARELGVAASVITFHPHPREVLGRSGYARYITPLADKLALLAELGVQEAYVIRFDRDFAAVEPEAFVERYLVPLKVRGVAVGFDFTFGHRGRGTADALVRLAAGRFPVDVVAPVTAEGEKVSSTAIRARLLEGRVDEAARLLGRPYAITGTVVAGNRIGRTLGFPTANVAPSEPYVIPAHGVYAAEVAWRDAVYDAVVNIGVRPTVAKGGEPTVEAHLLDFSGDLYGETIAVRFLRYLRPEQRFPDLDALRAQIARDIEAARRWRKTKA
ncbi:bifunctional riboflavin kinase/FAD synthetase [Calditerricola satsumensis]|uniref:Riboflavin biosynthesis protein n=2 Tax=Calditerricola satsumensis TaxID=373054 RepID=A0A8J3FA36_9BACI|nr:bifunctional riboflavin kinase/FAD synthetase [Calditerricola satsumensis]GGJ99384.1 riboflavin biosynthesis protein [Calditerricola satsumensis]